MTTRLAFLDLAGVVLFAYPHPDRDDRPCRGPWTFAEFRFVDWIDIVIKVLRAKSYQPVIVTNQADVTRGVISRDFATRVRDGVLTMLDLDAYYVCYHDDDARCKCRKPQPGLFITACDDFCVTPHTAIAIGDRRTDAQAAVAAGVGAVFTIAPNDAWHLRLIVDSL